MVILSFFIVTSPILLRWAQTSITIESVSEPPPSPVPAALGVSEREEKRLFSLEITLVAISTSRRFLVELLLAGGQRKYSHRSCKLRVILSCWKFRPGNRPRETSFQSVSDRGGYA